eukprot:CAMPEP_0204903422 /NCGR_PEP_ID=MMETSP1397-20131031/4241_1 /ASSEMBLY_ACC=CAM_ASM_000891 /TAXON_ID=49980 /ORGANISM="Climacostomum Climacostomum virens, Strain Stock W-24" /LENGTH=496 /DNA_ID=CAMNT_0052072049 /DNA_START=43 /DNA_END=1529 /DNA_ORIENTATION=-
MDSLLLHELNTSALELLHSDQPESAIRLLQKSEVILEQMKSRGTGIAMDFVLLTLNNSACCFQKQNNLELVASYLDACLFNIKDRLTLTDDEVKPELLWANKLLKKRVECRLHMQLCAVLSQLNKHESALMHAQEAIRLAHVVIKESLVICLEHLTNHKRMGKAVRSQHYRTLHELVLKAAPVYEYLDSKINSKPTKVTPKLDTRTSLGVIHTQDTLLTITISEVMQVKPLRLQDLQNTSGLAFEVQRDLVVDKVVLLLVSYFCNATELRFKYALEHNKKKLIEGRGFHIKCLEIARAMMPQDCPLVVHFVSSFNKNFASMDAKSDTSRSLKTLKKPDPRSTTRSKSPLLRTNIATKTRSSSRPRSTSTKRSRVKKDVSPLKTTDQKPRKLTPIQHNLTDRVRQSTPETSTLTHSSSNLSKPSSVVENAIDHSFMENFVLTSSALYGDSSCEDISRSELEESIDTRKSLSSTGGHKLRTMKGVKKLQRTDLKKLSG